MRGVAVDRRLEAIAGPPLAMLTVPNTSSPLDIGPTEARILYGVASTSALSNYGGIARIGTDSVYDTEIPGTQVMRTGKVGVGGVVHRGQVIGGVATFQVIPVGWPWDTPLAACGWWDGSRFGSQGYRSAPVVSEPSAVGSMNPAPHLWISYISTGTTPIAALAYRGIHDLTTRTRILSWLMQRYG